MTGSGILSWQLHFGMSEVCSAYISSRMSIESWVLLGLDDKFDVTRLSAVLVDLCGK